MPDGDLHKVSQSIGVLQGTVESLIRIQAESSATHFRMHESTQEKIAEVHKTLNKELNAHEKDIDELKEYVSTQKGLFAGIAAAGGLVGATVHKLLGSIGG